MTARIRLATLDDASGILAIYAPVVQNTFISFETEVPDVTEIQSRISKTLEQYPYLICEIDGSVAGYAYGSAFRSRRAYQWTTEVTVYVNENFQRRGVGRALYTALFEVLRQQGYYNAVGVIALPNAGSVTLHEIMGFEKIGVFRNMGNKLDDWHDTGWWQLELQTMPNNPPPPTPIQQVVESVRYQEALQAGISKLKFVAG